MLSYLLIPAMVMNGSSSSSNIMGFNGKQLVYLKETGSQFLLESCDFTGDVHKCFKIGPTSQYGIASSKGIYIVDLSRPLSINLGMLLFGHAASSATFLDDTSTMVFVDDATGRVFQSKLPFLSYKVLHEPESKVITGSVAVRTRLFFIDDSLSGTSMGSNPIYEYRWDVQKAGIAYQIEGTNLKNLQKSADGSCIGVLNSFNSYVQISLKSNRRYKFTLEPGQLFADIGVGRLALISEKAGNKLCVISELGLLRSIEINAKLAVKYIFLNARQQITIIGVLKSGKSTLVIQRYEKDTLRLIGSCTSSKLDWSGFNFVSALD
jgi:hypothetical protein